MAIKQLGKYEILEKLGEGATSEVYRARDTVLGRDVALKLLKPALMADPDSFERFTREAHAAADLFHDHIATVLDMAEADGRYFITMRLIPGESLDKAISRKGPLSWDETVRMARQIGSALDFAHSRGFLHRDVKPTNIIQTPLGDYVLADFGLMRAMMSTGLTSHTGAILGTPAYIPPEIWNNQKASPATDQYALACVVYEALTGQVLFAGETPIAVLTKHVNGPQFPEKWPEGVPEGVGEALQKALAKEPGERYASAGEFAGALERAGQKQPQALELPAFPEASTRTNGMKAEQEAQREEEAGRVKERDDTIERLKKEFEQALAARQHGKAKRIIGRLENLQVDTRTLEARLKMMPKKISPWVWAAVSMGVVILGIGYIVGHPFVQAAIPTATPATQAPSTAVPATAAPATQALVSTFDVGSTWPRPMDGMVMIYVPAGEFLMGSAASDTMAQSDEEPQHSVYLDAYWIDKTDVTNAEYALCVSAGICRSPSNPSSQTRTNYYGNSQYDNYPVIWVNWNDAQTYCQWAGARLLSEAEWEKAARGTDGRIYPWGSASPDQSLANYNGQVGDTSAVGSYPSVAGPYGALDMSGNVWQWVNDWFDANYYASSPGSNPQGPSSGTIRVLRGGAWGSFEFAVRAAFRFGYDPTDARYDFGLRCSRSAQ